MTAISFVGVSLAVALTVGGCNGAGEGSVAEPTTTTTTMLPSTTIDPIAAEEAAVSEAAVQARLAATQALINLDDPTAAESLSEFYMPGSPARATIDGDLEDLRTEGWRIRQHPTIAESVSSESITFTNGPPPTEATAVVCVVDPVIVYEPNGAPDGSDVIVNDVVYSYRLSYQMVKQDARWRLYSVTEIETWEGVTECPPAVS